MTTAKALPAHLVPTDPLMAVAWADGLRWAIGNSDILNRFRADTGNRFEPGRTAFDRMIDEATGAERAFVESFIAWFNDNIWGDLTLQAGAPESLPSRQEGEG